jgi:diguanylate cyclase (GGDEF)-like protein
VTSSGPLCRPGVGRRTWPFGLACVVAVVAAPLTDGPTDPWLLLAAFGFLVALSAAVACVPWTRLPVTAQAGPAFAAFAFVALVREGSGGSASGYGALVLLPILWLGLYGTRRQLLLAFGAMGTTLAAPILLLGPPGYPATEWRRLIVWAVVAPIAGLVVQALIRERAELLRTVERLSRTDPLTGTLNRRAWEEQVPLALQHASRTGEPVAVAVLDLDHFKAFNDAHGHPAGDRLLKAAAAAWQAELRPADVLARQGGEEFAVLMRGCGLDDAVEVIDRLRRAMPPGQSCSAGVAVWNRLESPEAVVQRADAALYRAKRDGRDRVCVAECVREAAPDRGSWPTDATDQAGPVAGTDRG